MTEAEMVDWIASRYEDAMARAECISAPEDRAVEALCLQHGYGAVMDAAMRLWIRLDPLGGAFIIGGCAGTLKKAVALRDTRLQESHGSDEPWDGQVP